LGRLWPGNFPFLVFINNFFQDKTGIFSDIGIPRTLTDVEVYYYSNCTQVGTVTKTVVIDGTAFTASAITITFANPETPLGIVFHYPQVTLTSLHAGQAITYVRTHLFRHLIQV
jgi:hypothetical protein